jgi:hypothetical protein
MTHSLLRIVFSCLIGAVLLCPIGDRPSAGGNAGDERIDAGADTVLNLADYWPPSGGRLYGIGANADDGTQLGESWHQDGYRDGMNRAGLTAEGTPFITALKFDVPDLRQGNTIVYARLRLSSGGSDMSGPLTLTVSGISPGGNPFSSADLPSEMPETGPTVTWRIPLPWAESRFRMPLYYASPDISSIINEMLKHPAWKKSGGILTFRIQGMNIPSGGAGFVSIYDFAGAGESESPALLEICRNVSDTFIGEPILGRPTDHSVTVNIMSVVGIEAYARVGTRRGTYDGATPPVVADAGAPLEIVIDGLSPDREYHYQVMYRGTGTKDFTPGWTGRFRTQRPRGGTYAFTIQSDSHMVGNVRRRNKRNFRLYGTTLGNILADRPDFHISMGDFAHIEFYTARSTSNLAEGIDRYLVQRHLMAELVRQTPFFLVLGNHEAEQGWRREREADSLEVWGTLARKITFPNPYPDGFFSGSTDTTECCGLRENYYAWEWGDALFVVIDPFWYTLKMPHRAGAYMPTIDAWDWTLGKRQYDWLYRTLAGSDAEWKFVFTHHLVGGVTEAKHKNHPYGRGGIDAAKYKVSGRPSFEWGGENSSGEYVFDKMRPGWDHGAIHDILVETGVDILFHGHDHCFVHEELDGIVYQECPIPSGGNYATGMVQRPFYVTGTIVNNSGHLRVTVSPDSVMVDYIRAVLPEDEPLYEDGAPVRNGTVSYSYVIHR